MPGYGGTGRAKLLYEGQQAYFFNQETVAAGTASRAFQLRRERGQSYPLGFAVQVAFGGAPGVFALDIQASETDNVNDYVTIGTISAVNANNVGRLDNVTTFAKFVRAVNTTFPNAVSITALLTR